MMENNVCISLSQEKKPLAPSTLTSEEKKPSENASVFVNQGAIAWNEKRREWVGDQSQKQRRVPKDPIIRPFVVPGTENQGVCISLAHCPLNDDIIASFRPKVQASSDILSSQYSPSTSRGVLGSHVIINRVDASNYLNLASIPANVSNIRLPKSAIISIDNCNPLFAYGDEATNGLSLRELPSLRVVQCFRPHQNPILDVKYATSVGRSILGCTSEDRLQIFSARIS